MHIYYYFSVFPHLLRTLPVFVPPEVMWESFKLLSAFPLPLGCFGLTLTALGFTRIPTLPLLAEATANPSMPLIISWYALALIAPLSSKSFVDMERFSSSSSHLSCRSQSLRREAVVPSVSADSWQGRQGAWGREINRRLENILVTSRGI